MRPGRLDLLMATAELWAQRSTCSRMAVGALFHTQGRILVQGYNGAPAGLPHCPDIGKPPMHSPESCRAVHAEQNAISWAAREGVRLNMSDLVCTHQPCLSCARSIINAGVLGVIFKYPYRLRDGLELLQEANIAVARWVAPGHLEEV